MASTTSLSRSALHLTQFCSLLYFVDAFIGRLDLVHGPSMQPTLGPAGQLVLVDKLSRRLLRAPLRRNDIVLADSHFRASHMVCKRVIGLPGDRLLLPGRGALLRVPPGHVWLEGDNPLDSHDSRAYGPVPEALVRGRVVARLWPPWAARTFARGGALGEGVLRNGSNAVVVEAARVEGGRGGAGWEAALAAGAAEEAAEAAAAAAEAEAEAATVAEAAAEAKAEAGTAAEAAEATASKTDEAVAAATADTVAAETAAAETAEAAATMETAAAVSETDALLAAVRAAAVLSGAEPQP